MGNHMLPVPESAIQAISLSTRKLELLYFDLRPGQTCHFQSDAPEGSDTFQWPVIERNRVGGFG